MVRKGASGIDVLAPVNVAVSRWGGVGARGNEAAHFARAGFGARREGRRRVPSSGQREARRSVLAMVERPDKGSGRSCRMESSLLNLRESSLRDRSDGAVQETPKSSVERNSGRKLLELGAGVCP